MINRTCIAVAAAAVLAVASVSTSTIAAARGGGGHGGGFRGSHAGRFDQMMVPPPPTPHFNNPGPQITPSRPGNPVNQHQQSSLPTSPLGVSEPSGGHRQPKVSEVPRTENPSDAAMLKMDRELDNKLESSICRGC